MIRSASCPYIDLISEQTLCSNQPRLQAALYLCGFNIFTTDWVCYAAAGGSNANILFRKPYIKSSLHWRGVKSPGHHSTLFVCSNCLLSPNYLNICFYSLCLVAWWDWQIRKSSCIAQQRNTHKVIGEKCCQCKTFLSWVWSIIIDLFADSKLDTMRSISHSQLLWSTSIIRGKCNNSSNESNRWKWVGSEQRTQCALWCGVTSEYQVNK